MVNSNRLIEEVLSAYRNAIGKDYDKYRNHVYRVFLNCLLLDDDKEHEEKYAYAAVFHDIGIWTDHTIDYLHPSIAQACSYLASVGKNDLIADITLMIYWHHKIKRYRGISEELVECFRKADWIDVSLGLVRFGADNLSLKRNRKNFPFLGFHFFLVKKLLKHFIRHPLHPLPMFKK